jgi:hypothetical protein
MATLNGKAKGPAGTKKLVIKPLKRERARSGGGRPRGALARGPALPPLPAPPPASPPAPYAPRRTPTEQPKLPENFERDTWAKLEDAVDAVHGKRTVACSLEELYRVRRPPRAARRAPPPPLRRCRAAAGPRPACVQRPGCRLCPARPARRRRHAAPAPTLNPAAPAPAARAPPFLTPRPSRTCAPTRCRTTCTSDCRRRAMPTSAARWARCRSRCGAPPLAPARCPPAPEGGGRMSRGEQSKQALGWQRLLRPSLPAVAPLPPGPPALDRALVPPP